MRILHKDCRSQKSIRQGFTILELLIVSILMVIVMMITSQFWKWFSPCLADLIAREHLLREARLVTQSFAYDFGSATEITGGDQLVINGNIYYYRQNSSDPNLYRRNISGSSEFVIADCISDFSVVENPAGSNIWDITLQFEARSYKNSQPFSRELVFHWSPPN